MFGAVEAGGTKFRCAVGTHPDNLVDEVRFDTSTPDETLAQVISFFRDVGARVPIHAVGVGSFGPIDLRKDSATYGCITSTPKKGWRNVNIVSRLRASLNIPVGFDTDVAAAALAEHRWGAALGVRNVVYLTVGTGIGGGAIVDGKVVHGAVHPEMGHMLIPHRADDTFPGICPFHGDCFEGLSSGVAIEERWGTSGLDLPVEHDAWELEAHYLAYGLSNVILTLSPERIVMGGGVMEQMQLFPLVRRKIQQLLNGYVSAREVNESMDEFVVPPALNHRSGILGALVLAERAAVV